MKNIIEVAPSDVKKIIMNALKKENISRFVLWNEPTVITLVMNDNLIILGMLISLSPLFL